MLCADCNSRNASSVVFNIAPQLPQHPGFKGKFIKPFYSLFRSPDRPDRITAFKVSVSVFRRSTDISRYGFDTATLTAGSNDLQATFWVVWEWLHAAHTFKVSCFGFMALADFSRYGFESSVSTAPSNGSVRMLYKSDGWPG